MKQNVLYAGLFGVAFLIGGQDLITALAIGAVIFTILERLTIIQNGIYLEQ
jgi:hypothetical protein